MGLVPSTCLQVKGRRHCPSRKDMVCPGSFQTEERSLSRPLAPSCGLRSSSRTHALPPTSLFPRSAKGNRDPRLGQAPDYCLLVTTLHLLLPTQGFMTFFLLHGQLFSIFFSFESISTLKIFRILFFPWFLCVGAGSGLLWIRICSKLLGISSPL